MLENNTVNNNRIFCFILHSSTKFTLI
ncbi:hypothetical protein [Tenacibaculum holothuriorum]